MRALAVMASHRDSWTHGVESPALNGGEQTCTFPWTGIVQEEALC